MLEVWLGLGAGPALFGAALGVLGVLLEEPPEVEVVPLVWLPLAEVALLVVLLVGLMGAEVAPFELELLVVALLVPLGEELGALEGLLVPLALVALGLLGLEAEEVVLGTALTPPELTPVFVLEAVVSEVWEPPALGLMPVLAPEAEVSEVWLALPLAAVPPPLVVLLPPALLILLVLLAPVVIVVMPEGEEATVVTVVTPLALPPALGLPVTTLHSPRVVLVIPFSTNMQYGSPVASSYRVIPVRFSGEPTFKVCTARFCI